MEASSFVELSSEKIQDLATHIESQQYGHDEGVLVLLDILNVLSPSTALPADGKDELSSFTPKQQEYILKKEDEKVQPLYDIMDKALDNMTPQQVTAFQQKLDGLETKKESDQKLDADLETLFQSTFKNVSCCVGLVRGGCVVVSSW